VVAEPVEQAVACRLRLWRCTPWSRSWRGGALSDDAREARAALNREGSGGSVVRATVDDRPICAPPASAVHDLGGDPRVVGEPLGSEDRQAGAFGEQVSLAGQRESGHARARTEPRDSRQNRVSCSAL
jgi:hypothetical protein